MNETDRRTLLRGAAVTGVALPLVAACGNSGSSGSTADIGPSGEKLAATSDVPVGGGVILTDKEVVVTQPEQDTYKAFSAVCTHQGCLVGLIDGGQIICPCHGSAFSITDGSVTRGPAGAPLPEVKVTVANGEVDLA